MWKALMRIFTELQRKQPPNALDRDITPEGCSRLHDCRRRIFQHAVVDARCYGILSAQNPFSYFYS